MGHSPRPTRSARPAHSQPHPGSLAVESSEIPEESAAADAADADPNDPLAGRITYRPAAPSRRPLPPTPPSARHRTPPSAAGGRPDSSASYYSLESNSTSFATSALSNLRSPMGPSARRPQSRDQDPSQGQEQPSSRASSAQRHWSYRRNRHRALLINSVVSAALGSQASTSSLGGFGDQTAGRGGGGGGGGGRRRVGGGERTDIVSCEPSTISVVLSPEGSMAAV